jgi:quercetin dioxygenase-like cupin family protein
MINDQIENPVTGERIVFREGMGDPAAEVLAFDFFVRPGGGVFVPHMHEHQTETIRVVQGRLVCGMPGAVREVGPGEGVTFQPGEGHVLHAVGPDEVKAYVEFRPAGGAESFLRNYFGLCRDGKSTDKGDLPLAQIALLMPKHGNWRADIPLLAQRLLFAVLEPIAWLRGYRPTYARYARNPR